MWGSATVHMNVCRIYKSVDNGVRVLDCAGSPPRKLCKFMYESGAREAIGRVGDGEREVSMVLSTRIGTPILQRSGVRRSPQDLVLVWCGITDTRIGRFLLELSSNLVGLVSSRNIAAGSCWGFLPLALPLLIDHAGKGTMASGMVSRSPRPGNQNH